MDRVFERVNSLNAEWMALNSELQTLALIHPDKRIRDLYERFHTLRGQFANIITLGQNDAWRYMAVGNGFDLPEGEGPGE